MEKEHHHVHFGDDADSFGKDNEIVVQAVGEDKIAFHLGFLKVNHRYEIDVSVPHNICNLNDSALEFSSSDEQAVPNVNCKLCRISNSPDCLQLTFELLAYKEKLLKEEICVECSNRKSPLRFNIIARVLGKGKGTPLLRNGIRCIKVEDADDDSETSDWQGF